MGYKFFSSDTNSRDGIVWCSESVCQISVLDIYCICIKEYIYIYTFI